MVNGNKSPFLDKNSEIKIKVGGYLPHWFQDGKMQYVTFRLFDSLPKNKIDELKECIAQFEKFHPKPWTLKTKKEYKSRFGHIREELLHQGYGSCLLANSKVREIVSSAILYKDNQDYYVYAYVIMPNHIHLLIQPFERKELEKILHSIKLYSARKINMFLGRKGRLWCKESYDHIVRDYDEMKHCYSYIINNPKNLPPNSFTLYTT